VCAASLEALVEAEEERHRKEHPKRRGLAQEVHAKVTPFRRAQRGACSAGGSMPAFDEEHVEVLDGAEMSRREATDRLDRHLDTVAAAARRLASSVEIVQLRAPKCNGRHEWHERSPVPTRRLEGRGAA